MGVGAGAWASTPTESELDVRVLGSLEVTRDGMVVGLGGPKQRAVLALLLVHVGGIVSRDQVLQGRRWTFE